MTHSRREKREDIPYCLHVHVCGCESSRSDLIYTAYLHMPKRSGGGWVGFGGRIPSVGPRSVRLEIIQTIHKQTIPLFSDNIQ